jgi:hypothetical protein
MMIPLSCAPSPELKEIRVIAESIQKPQPSYSYYTGRQLVLRNIIVRGYHYDTSSGERRWEIIIHANEPTWWRRNFGGITMSAGQETYMICVPNFYPKEEDNPYYYSLDKIVFTISELRKYKDRLVWK